MSSYLAYTRFTRPTGRVIALELGLRYGINKPPESPEVLIRWGSRRRMGSPGRVLHRAKAIARAADKLATLDRLLDAAIPHVPFFRSWEEALDETGGSGIILGRSRYGMRGRDIVVYDPA